MNDKEIGQAVAGLFAAIKANDDSNQQAAGMALVTNFLVNQQRIADSLDKLSQCVADPNQTFMLPSFNVSR